jgi:hypothetical protein
VIRVAERRSGNVGLVWQTKGRFDAGSRVKSEGSAWGIGTTACAPPPQFSHVLYISTSSRLATATSPFATYHCYDTRSFAFVRFSCDAHLNALGPQNGPFMPIKPQLQSPPQQPMRCQPSINPPLFACRGSIYPTLGEVEQSTRPIAQAGAGNI